MEELQDIYFYETDTWEKGACLDYKEMPKNTALLTLKRLSVSEIADVLESADFSKYIK